jgi:protocatechuate 3,4-dioxygenase beta subunit
MHKKRKPQARVVARRDTLKGGLSALALAAVGCSTDQVGTAGPAQSSPAGAGPESGGKPAPNVVAGAPGASSSAAGTTGSSPSASTAGMRAPAASAGTSAAAPSAGSPATSPSGATGGASAQAGAPMVSGGTGGAAASGMHSPTTDLASLQCIVTPAMTDGPFFVEEKLNRSNLIMGETSEAIVKAVPLHLVMGVYEVNGMMCKPLTGVQVDIWQADAIGIYSDVASGVVQAEDTRGKKSLRGYQLTDEQGIVVFDTVYPGWYMSRTIHIHFKLRMLHTSGNSASEFTSQMFFDEAINAMVLAKPAYSNRSGKRSVLNDADHIFNGTASNGQKPAAGSKAPGESIMPTLVATGDSYTATLKIGIKA